MLMHVSWTLVDGCAGLRASDARIIIIIIIITGDAETSWIRRSICMRVKETAKPHGPVDAFAGGSRRLRNFMDP